MPNPSTTPPKLETPLNTFYESHFDTILFVVLVVSLLFILITSIRNFFLVARVHKENQTPGMIQHSVKIGWLGIELTPVFPPHASAFREAKPDLLEGLKGTLTNPPKDKNEKDPKDKDDKVQSPLDQFTILPLMDIQIGKLYFSFTNPSLFMLLTLSLVLLFLYFVTKKGGGKSVPNAWQSLVELLYSFVLNLVNEQIGGQSGKQKFFPCISVTLTFLLFCNLQGMIPYSFTVTSHFLITLGLSFSLFIGITLVGFARNGLHFLSFSLPAGVPLPLAPFLVLLELIPYSFRALSLGIRLFANMMAGHSLVKILSGFAWTMLCMGDPLYFIGDLGPLLIVLALTGLELGVAILQAYVFTILICIYLNDAINLH